MLDDLMFTEEEVQEVQSPQTPSSSGYQQYQKNNQNNWNNSGGNSGWKKNEEVIEEPYAPIAIYIDRDFPQEIKDRLTAIASKLISKNFTVRINGDDVPTLDPVRNLSREFVEIYTPWKNFNDIESKLYWNTKTANHMAEMNFGAWDKVPSVVQAMLGRNVRMIFGNRNNSIAKCLITWSPDGATKHGEVTRDTGRASFMIALASKYHYPVLNIQKEGTEDNLSKLFGL